MSRRKDSEGKKRILVLVAGGVLILAMVLGVIIPLFMGIGAGANTINTEGVFVLLNGKWVRQELGASPWIPTDNGTYIVYFKNLECPACKAFDPIWDEYVEEYVKKGRGEPVTPVVVSCTWFTQRCSDPTAYASFVGYQVPFSPALLVWHNGTVMYYGQAPQTPSELDQLVKEAVSGEYLRRALEQAGNATSANQTQ